MKAKAITVILLLCSIIGSGCDRGTPYQIVISDDATALERFAARELRRYVYHRTDELLSVVTSGGRQDDKVRFIVATQGSDLLRGIEASGESTNSGLEDQEYILRSVAMNGLPVIIIVGGSSTSTLYGVYEYAELLGVRFYLHGDVIPDDKIPLSFSDIDVRGTPLFDVRGILPFHDFPEGPDWWNDDDYKAIFAQLPKLKMNFAGFHTYPERRDFNGEGHKAEPLVWIGPEEDMNPDGTVKTGYPVLHFHTFDSTWGYAPLATSRFHYGASQLFETDNFGADYIKDISE